MEAFNKLRRAIVSRIPGNAQHIATAKRQLERDLRAQGYSRNEAKRIVAERHDRNAT